MEGVLRIAHHNAIQAVALMDSFERLDGNHNPIYSTLQIKNPFHISYCGVDYKVDLYIQRKAGNAQTVQDSITFTTFKKSYAKRLYTQKTVRKPLVVATILASLPPESEQVKNRFWEMELWFENPIEIKMRRSINRCGGADDAHNRRIAQYYTVTTPYLITGGRLYL